MKGRTRASSRSHVGKEDGDEAAVNQSSAEVIIGDLIWVKLHGSSWWPGQVVNEKNVSGRIKPRVKPVGEVLVRLYGSYKYLYADPIRCGLDFENILKEHNGSYSEIFKKSLEQDILRCKSGRSKGKGLKSEAELEASLGKMSKQNIANRRICSANPPRTPTKNGDLLSQKTEEGRSRKRKHEAMQNEVVPNARKSPRISSKRLTAASTPQRMMKNGNLLSENTAELKDKKQGQDKLVLSSKTLQTPRQVVMHEKTKPNDPESAATSVGNFRELSARRMKIMQSLGLSAPSGSPFQRN